MKEGEKGRIEKGGSIKRMRERKKKIEVERVTSQHPHSSPTWSNWNRPYGSSFALTTKIKVFWLPISAP